MNKKFIIANNVISINAPVFYDDCVEWNCFDILSKNVDENSISPENKYQINCSVVSDFPYDLKTENALEKQNVSGKMKVAVNGGKYICENDMGCAKGVQTVIDFNSSESQSFFTEHSFKTMTDTRYLWTSVCLPQILLEKKVLLLHSSYIKYNGRGILFSGSCGAGKSTQAQMWKTYRGADIINGDKSAISVIDNSPYVHGVPFCGTSGICKNESYPLSAIVFPVKSSGNEIKRLSYSEAVSRVLNNVYLDFLVPDELIKCTNILIDVLSKVPVYELKCTPDEEAVKVLDSVI